MCAHFGGREAVVQSLGAEPGAQSLGRDSGCSLGEGAQGVSVQRGLCAEALGLGAERPGCRELVPRGTEAWVQRGWASVERCLGAGLLGLGAERLGCRAWVQRAWLQRGMGCRAWVQDSGFTASGCREHVCPLWGAEKLWCRVWVQSLVPRAWAESLGAVWVRWPMGSLCREACVEKGWA